LEIPNATLSKCGKTLKTFTTTLSWKHYRGTRLITVPNGNNVKDWVIRSQSPKAIAMEKVQRLYDSGFENSLKLKI
jgi:hypothetical protein